MQFTPFDLEYTQSIWEQKVDINLTESGVHPIRLDDLLGDDKEKLATLLSSELNYPHVNGNPELRESIAALYDGARTENVIVTVGAAEANNVVIQTLLDEGDCLATQAPTYKQVWGLAQNKGCEVRPFHLLADEGWRLDVDDLNAQVTANTRMVALCHPNNPTGHMLSSGQLDAAVDAADHVGT